MRIWIKDQLWTITINISPSSVGCRNKSLDRQSEGHRANPLILFFIPSCPSSVSVCQHSNYNLRKQEPQQVRGCDFWRWRANGRPVGPERSGCVRRGGPEWSPPVTAFPGAREWISTAGIQASISAGLRDGPLHLLLRPLPLLSEPRISTCERERDRVVSTPE